MSLLKTTLDGVPIKFKESVLVKTISFIIRAFNNVSPNSFIKSKKVESVDELLTSLVTKVVRREAEEFELNDKFHSNFSAYLSPNIDNEK